MTDQPSPSALIDLTLERLGDWRGKTLKRLRALIREADPATAGTPADLIVLEVS